jgi:acetyl-CoA carboxylase biotin carboxyl carrier protein
VDYKAIINLMKEMNHTDLTKLEIEEEGVKICLEKAGNIVNVTQSALPQINMSSAAFPGNPAAMYQPMPYYDASQATTPVVHTETALQTAEKSAEDANHKKIVSPMVGTFYASSSPDKAAFVKVGDKVKKGQTVCIIEAMKLMNEIESDHDGEIVKILVTNEQMVEFGQPLFLVK